jgi:hypothetical protein
MSKKAVEAAQAAFASQGPAITLGAVVHEGQCYPGPIVTIPLGMMNRHGLIAGATGTGKTKTLQLMAEQLSAAGVPVCLADIKGDVSGIAVPGEANDKITQRVRLSPGTNAARWSETAPWDIREDPQVTGGTQRGQSADARDSRRAAGERAPPVGLVGAGRQFHFVWRNR